MKKKKTTGTKLISFPTSVERQGTLKEFQQAVAAVRASAREDGLDKLSGSDINKEISAARKERRKRVARSTTGESTPKQRETLIKKYGKKAKERGITENDVVRIIKDTRIKEGSPKKRKR